MSHVYYHHPGNKQFSLEFVNPEASSIVEHIADHDDELAAKVMEYDIEQQFYVVYSSRSGGKPVRDLELGVREVPEKLDGVTGPIVLRLSEVYQSLIDRNEEEEGSPVIAYKDPSVVELGEVFDRVGWTGTATDVAGKLASSLILKHALPNANHRTAIALIQLYLRCFDDSFALPETKQPTDSGEFDWQEWVNQYINDSKRLLTVRRKNVVFKHLQSFGVTVVERKHDVIIDLSEYDLDMYPSEAEEEYGQQHQELWIEFVEEAVERAGRGDLKQQQSLTKEEFARKLKSLD